MEVSQITTVEQLQTYLLEKGASKEQADAQISKLGEVIVLETLGALLQQKPPADKLAGDEEAAAYIHGAFTSEEISQHLEATATSIIQDYLQAIRS